MALYRHDLARLITETITGDEFVVFDVLPDRTQQSAFEGRMRVYRVRLKCIVASAHIPQVLTVQPVNAS